MKIKIIGENSFVGRAFIESCTKRVCEEVCLKKTQPDSIDFTGIDTVLHLTAIVHQKKGTPEELYFRVNRDLALEVAKRAKTAGVKHFVFLSTVKVFGESTKANPWNENSYCTPEDAYGKSKFEAEKLLRELEDNTFKVAIVRSPLVYGEGVKANMLNLIKLVDRFPLLPFGGVNNKRTIVYIGNLVALLNRIIEQNASGLYLAGDQDPVSTSRIVEFIASSMNKRILLVKIPILGIKILSIITPGLFLRLFGSLEINTRKTNETLNYLPPWSTYEGISNMTKWYLAQKRK